MCERVCLYVRETDCKKCAILQSLNFDKNVKQEIEKKINSNFWLIFFRGKSCMLMYIQRTRSLCVVLFLLISLKNVLFILILGTSVL